ncbi:MAG TPA: radical SAM protein [Candidatus Sulfotelmatobacter sp.]|nr:radical SAM protein [Candidatus Sulfotelmatobacter sp.]
MQPRLLVLLVVQQQSEGDVARRSIDWLHDNGCRVLALMGGEPLLRPDFIHKVVYYAAKKGFWVYIATNGRLLKPEFADRLGDAGVAVFNFALDSWDLQPSLPKAFVLAEKNLKHILRIPTGRFPCKKRQASEYRF